MIQSTVSDRSARWAGLGWAGLGWDGLGWAGLGWAGLGWAGLGWAGLGWAGLGWVGLRATQSSSGLRIAAFWRREELKPSLRRHRRLSHLPIPNHSLAVSSVVSSR